MFTLWFVSTINYDALPKDKEIKKGKKKKSLVKNSWLALNNMGTETIQEVYISRYAMYCFSIMLFILFLLIVIMQGAQKLVLYCNPIYGMN
jgi:hypothetical protein